MIEGHDPLRDRMAREGAPASTPTWAPWLPDAPNVAIMDEPLTHAPGDLLGFIDVQLHKLDLAAGFRHNLFQDRR